MRTFLFLHGWGGNAESFKPISQYFERTIICGQACRILAPSLPCPPQAVYTLDDYANDVEAYLQEQQVTQCIVIAHSFGARIVAILNARHPDLFKQIIITGGAGLIVRKSFHVKWKIWWYKIRRRLGFKIHGGSTDYQKLDDNGKRTFQNIIHRDLSAEVRQIMVPLLLIWGSKDRDTPLVQLRRWCQLVPHAQKVIYKNKGHFAYLEDSARFIIDVTRFLKVHCYGGQDDAL